MQAYDFCSDYPSIIFVTWLKLSIYVGSFKYLPPPLCYGGLQSVKLELVKSFASEAESYPLTTTALENQTTKTVTPLFTIIYLMLVGSVPVVSWHTI